MRYEDGLENSAMRRAIDIADFFNQIQSPPDDTWQGENIAQDFNTPEAVVAAWMGSKEHKERLLNNGFHTTGVGVYLSNKTVYWVQQFRGIPVSSWSILKSATLNTAASPRVFGASTTANQQAILDALKAVQGNEEVYTSLLLNTISGNASRFTNTLTGEMHSTMSRVTYQMGRNYTRALLGQSSAFAMNRKKQFRHDSEANPASKTEPSQDRQDDVRRTRNLWFSTSGSYNTLNSKNSLGKTSFYGPEIYGGYEMLLPGNWILGVSSGYSSKKMRVRDRKSSADIESYSASLYGGKEFVTTPGTVRLIAGGAYTRHQMDSDRTVHLDSGKETLSDGYGANAWQAYPEGSFIASPWDAISLEPFVSLSYHYEDMGRISENGGEAALSSRKDHRSNTDSTVGMRFRADISGSLQINAEAGWRHTYARLHSSREMAFKTNSAAAFTIEGNGVSRDEAILGLGVAYAITEQVQVGLDYQTALGADSQSHSGYLTLGFQW